LTPARKERKKIFRNLKKKERQGPGGLKVVCDSSKIRITRGGGGPTPGIFSWKRKEFKYMPNGKAADLPLAAEGGRCGNCRWRKEERAMKLLGMREDRPGLRGDTLQCQGS